MSLEQEIKDQALRLGFDAAGITDASPIGREHVAHLEKWLRCGYAGRMAYMHRHLDKRVQPARLLEGAESVVVVALSYKPMDDEVRPAQTDGPTGRVAQYAQYQDYHEFMKAVLLRLAEFIRNRTKRDHRCKACVDSAPLAEKALAVRAGLGFIGRNHLLIHPTLGPQVLLGEVVTTARLQPDEPGEGACTNCDRCVRACPTGALRPDGFLDATRCISYLTQYEAQDERARAIGDWLFGCDECLLACPHRQAAPPMANRRFSRSIGQAGVDLRELLRMSPAEFASRFHDSPMSRTGLERLQRNARLCLEKLNKET